MMKMTTSAVLMLTTLMAVTSIGCIPVSTASNTEVKVAKSFAPPVGMANLYIFRTFKYGNGLAGDPEVEVDGKAVAVLVENTFAMVTVPAGTHAVRTYPRGSFEFMKDGVSITVVAESGHNHFVKVLSPQTYHPCNLSMTTPFAYLKHVAEGSGKEIVSGLTLVK